MVDRRDIELVLRATDQSSRQFADVKRAVEGITTALNQQLGAAEKGEAAFEGLTDQLKQLKTAQDSLIKQQALIDQFRNLGTQLEAAETKAKESRAAHAALAGTFEEGAKKTKAQREELAQLNGEANKAERSVKTLTERLSRQAEALAAAGIAVNALEETQRELADTAQLLGNTRAAAIEGEQRYTAAIKATTEAEKAQKAALAEAIPTIRARMLVAQEAARAAARERELNADPRAALAGAINPLQVRAVVAGAAERDAAQAAAQRDALAGALAPARAVAAAAADRDKEAAAIQRTLESYRQLADQLGQTTIRYTTLGDVSSTIPERINRVSDALLRINDPNAAQRSTISGLEDQVLRLSDAVIKATGPVKDYEVQLRLLAAAQQSAADKGRAIDTYQQQVAVLRAARAEFVAARTAVNDYANQLRTTTAPNDELRAKAAAAGTALAAASREMQNQFAQARTLREALTAAGIDTAKLADEERKLIQVTGEAVAISARLTKQFEENGRSTAGNGPFGLSPYAIQNLGYQLNDIFVQLSSGTSILQTLSQQGPQILQAIPGAFRAIASAWPAALAGIVAVTGAFATLSRAIDDLAQNRAFAGYLQASVDGTTYQTAALVELQRTLRDFGNTSEEATQAIRTFIDAGIRPEQLSRFALAAQDIVDLFGGKLPDAAKRLADGFTGGYEAVAKLNEQYNFLTAPQAERIRKMFEEGDGAKALAEAFNLLRQRQAAAAEIARGEFTTAMREGRAAVSDLLGAFADTGYMQLWLQKVRESALSISALIRFMRGAREEAARMPGDGTPGGAGASPDTLPGDVGASQAQRTRDAAYLRAQQERIALNDRQNAQLRIELAGRAALADAQSKNLSPLAAQAAQAAAIAEATRDQRRAEEELLDTEQRRGDSTRTLTREEKIRADGQRAADAAQRIGAPETVQRQARAAAELATTRELTAAERGRVEALQNRLDMTREMTAQQRITAAGAEAARKAQDAGDTADGIREQRRLAEEIKRREIAREGQGGANARVNLERELQNELSQLRATADRQERTQLDSRLRAIDERYARIFQNIDRLKATGATTVQGQPINEFAAQVEAQKELLKNNETLKFYEDSLNATIKERRDTYRDIAERQRAGEITGAQAFREQQAVTERLTPRMRQLADEAVRFAQGLRGADPNPRIDAAIARFQRLGNTDTSQGGTDAAGREGANQAVAEQMREVNRLFAERNALVESYQTQAARGAITQTQADEKIRDAYAETNGALQTNIDRLREVNEATRGVRTATEYDLVNAKLQEMGSSLAYINPLVKALRGGFEQAFSSSLLTAFDSLGQSLGGLIAGTKSWGDVLRDAGKIGLQLVADLLKGIAMTILKFYALRLASEAMKLVGLGEDAAASGAQIAGAAATTTAAAALGSAGGVVAGGAAVLEGASLTLGVSAAALAAAAQLLIVANSLRAAGGVAHEGGIAGSLLRTRAVSPSWFIGAPRYHSGGMAGLQPNEVPAILERGEEVLNTKNPRHIINAGKRVPGDAAGGGMSIRNVLVMDPKAIPEAMTGGQGETVTMTHIRRNLPAIRQMLNTGSRR